MNIKTNPSSLAVLVAVGMVSLSGCVSRGAYIESTLGESLAQTQASQTLNPDASLNTDPVTGLDGQAAEKAIDRYERSFSNRPLIQDYQRNPPPNAGGGTGSR